MAVRRCRAGSRPGEARLLPFVEILIGVESDHLLPSAAPGPDLPSEAGELLGAPEPLRRRAFEIRRQALPAGVRGPPRGVHRRVGPPHPPARRTGHGRPILPLTLPDPPAHG